MRNLLSYVGYESFTGKEIKDWITYHTENQTSKTKVAKTLVKYLNIKDDRLYRFIKETDRCSSRYGKYLIEEVLP